MTAFDAINFIHEKAWRGSKPGLSRTKHLLELLGNPEKGLSFVHLAGTNGKGSTAALLSGALTASGLKTGLYTSPYISRFNERMQINGAPIPDKALAEITEKIAPLALSMDDRPTEFELVTVIAFQYFAQEGCDIVVLEAGMGGRLDSTNVINYPLCSVITNIGLDHVRELGDTVEKITGEKAGIIKPDCNVVAYDLQEGPRRVLEKHCAEKSAKLTFADFSQLSSEADGLGGQIFSYKSFRHLNLPLLGAHQQKNAAVALEVILVLREKGFLISDEAVNAGFAATVWPARFEIVREKPFVVVDGGHNPQCAETVADNLQRYFPGKKKILLFGVLADKDYMGMARALDAVADYYVTIEPLSSRALSSEGLANELKIFGKPVFPCNSIEEGIIKALSIADDDSVICSVGSLYSAGTVREFFEKGK